MKRTARVLAAVLLFVCLLPAGAAAVCTTCSSSNVLEWTAPTTNADASALTDFAGFEVLIAAASPVCTDPSVSIINVGALSVPATPAPSTVVNVTLGSLNLALGAKIAAVRAYDTAANRGACSAEVSFTYAAQLSVTPSSLTFVANANGPQPAAQPLTISNLSAPPMTWTVSDDAAWLVVAPSSGNGGTVTVVTVNTAGLATNVYNATITVSAPGAIGSPATIPVTLSLSPTASPAAGRSGRTR